MRRGEPQPAGAVFVMALLVLAVACRGGGEPALTLVTDTEDDSGRVRATLAHRCVVGGGEQALTVRVEEGVGVSYVSTYADGQTGRAEPHGPGYGGEGTGLSSDGAMEESWTVSEQAPPGIVIVYVSALLPDAPSVDPDEALTRLRLSFLLVSPDEECPEGEPELPTPEVVTDTADADPRARATLAHDCVEAGGRQTLKVRAERGSSVAYTTVYANGENGAPRPGGGGYGGSGFGVVPEDEVELSWTIEKEAPSGIARVLVKVTPLGHHPGQDADEEVARVELAFRLVGSEETCP